MIAEHDTDQATPMTSRAPSPPSDDGDWVNRRGIADLLGESLDNVHKLAEAGTFGPASRGSRNSTWYRRSRVGLYKAERDARKAASTATGPAAATGATVTPVPVIDLPPLPGVDDSAISLAWHMHADRRAAVGQLLEESGHGRKDVEVRVDAWAARNIADVVDDVLTIHFPWVEGIHAWRKLDLARLDGTVRTTCGVAIEVAQVWVRTWLASPSGEAMRKEILRRDRAIAAEAADQKLWDEHNKEMRAREREWLRQQAQQKREDEKADAEAKRLAAESQKRIYDWIAERRAKREEKRKKKHD